MDRRLNNDDGDHYESIKATMQDVKSILIGILSGIAKNKTQGELK